MAVGGGNTFALPLTAARFLTFDQAQAWRERELSGRYPSAVSPLARELAALGSHDIADESLGSRRIAGVETTGRRITMTIPVGQSRNDRPIEIVDERWESPELKLLIYSRYSDPRMGIIEYRLSNIRRVEPPSDLFVIPADYTAGGTNNEGSWRVLESAENVKRASGGRRRN